MKEIQDVGVYGIEGIFIVRDVIGPYAIDLLITHTVVMIRIP